MDRIGKKLFKAFTGVDDTFLDTPYAEALLLAMETDQLPELIRTWDFLPVADENIRERPMTMEELALVTRDDLLECISEQEVRAINESLTIARAYAIRIAELSGAIETIDYIAIYNKNKRAKQEDNNEGGSDIAEPGADL